MAAAGGPSWSHRAGHDAAGQLQPQLHILQAPDEGLSFELKPYAIADLTTDRGAANPRTNDPSGADGIDVKYGITENLVADVTVNTDFAQVEADEQQVNLTRFSPRLHSSPVIRKLTWEGTLDHVTDRADVLETRQAQGTFGIEFESSDRLEVTYTRNYEFLDRPFRVSRDVRIPVGGYRFDDVQVSMQLGPQQPLAGSISFHHGGFFSGDRTSVDLQRGRIDLTRQLSVEPGLSFNWIDLPEGSFTTELVTARTTYTITPLMFVSALLQYNSSIYSLGANIRMRWEYQPGSELFVVYNEQRDTLARRFPGLENRALIIKFNRLFRF